MTIRKEVKKKQFFKEMQEKNQTDLFEFKDKKFIHAIDTMYYSVTLEEDFNNFENWDNEDNGFSREWVSKIKELKKFKQKFEDDVLNGKVEFDDLYISKGFRMYQLNFNLTNVFDIGFCVNKLPNKETPRILIRLYSESLWCDGVQKTLESSIQYLKLLLEYFNLGEIKEVKENRIDYAFHSNYIQNMYKYFSDERLCEIYEGDLTRGSKIFELEKGEMDIQYLTFGSRKSNNVFFRVYDKTREVIEEGKKPYFLEIWLDKKMISLYDYEILEKCFIRGSMECVGEIMCEYYLKNGTDDNFKCEIGNALIDYNRKKINQNDLLSIALEIMPKVSTVLNFEFETHKKFYDTFKIIKDFPVDTNSNEIELLRLFQVLDNRKIFLEVLTEKTVVFKADFWKRLSALKINKSCLVVPSREYRKNKHMLNKTCLEILGKCSKLSTIKDESEKSESYSETIVKTLDIIYSDKIDKKEVQKKMDKVRSRVRSEIMLEKKKEKKSLKRVNLNDTMC